MRDLTQPPPAIKITVTQLQCTSCGAETHAACSCGKPYMPKLQRAAEAVAAHPEKSNRMLAEETGVSEATMRRARDATASSDAVGESRTGKDGRARRPPSFNNPNPTPRPPVRQALIDDVMRMIKEMRDLDFDTWAKFDRIYQRERDKLSEIAF